MSSNYLQLRRPQRNSSISTQAMADYHCYLKTKAHQIFCLSPKLQSDLLDLGRSSWTRYMHVTTGGYIKRYSLFKKNHWLHFTLIVHFRHSSNYMSTNPHSFTTTCLPSRFRVSRISWQIQYSDYVKFASMLWNQNKVLYDIIRQSTNTLTSAITIKCYRITYWYILETGDAVINS